jgi:LppX_LprAFG lipoprotein
MRRSVLVLLVLPLAAAACGGGGGGKSSVVKVSPVAYVRGAAHKTAAATSEHVQLTGSATAAGQEIHLTGSGDFDRTQKLEQIHVNVDAGPLASTVDGIYSGTILYLSSPLLASSLPNGKSWLEIDLAKALKASGIDVSALAGQDPSKTLAQLESLGGVSAVGTDQVGGVATTHYRGQIDPSKLPQAAKIPALAQGGAVPYDVWVGNGDGYVRKVSFRYAITAGGKSASTSLSETFSSFGEHVSVSVPNDADVYDATNLATKRTGG